MNNIPRLWLWCRDCSKEAQEDCADSSHSLCSLRKLRAEQAAPKLQQLRDAAEFATLVLKALGETRDIVQNQISEWEGKLGLMEKGERDLKAAVDACQDPATVPLEGLQHVEEVTSRLTARWCEVKLMMKNDAIEWRWVISGSEVRLLSLPVVQLHQNGIASQVFHPDTGGPAEGMHRRQEANPPPHGTSSVPSQPSALQRPPDQEVFCGPCMYRPQESRDVGSLRTRCQRDEFLQDPDLGQVRKLDGVHCKKWPDWCGSLLRRVAPQVEWLFVKDALREHLDEVRNMAALKFLYVHVDQGVHDAPVLPLQLHELEVDNISLHQLRSVQEMAHLRRLAVLSLPKLNVVFPARPADHQGLQELCVAVRPCSTLLSLVKANAQTLENLWITCASEGNTPWNFQDLPEGLRSSALSALRRIVLLRSFDSPEHSDDVLHHNKASCSRQKQDIVDQLGQQVLHEPGRNLQIFCYSCDECPHFPALGDFSSVDG